MFLGVFEWCEASVLGSFVRDSQVLFPLVEALHLVAFAAIGGAILLVDLRLLGVAMTGRPVSEVEQEAHPWLARALLAMLVTGSLLFVSEAVKCYYSTPFWWKMTALALAVPYTLVVKRPLLAHTTDGAFGARLLAVVSIVLWGTVAWGGRWIGFSG